MDSPPSQAERRASPSPSAALRERARARPPARGGEMDGSAVCERVILVLCAIGTSCAKRSWRFRWLPRGDSFKLQSYLLFATGVEPSSSKCALSIQRSQCPMIFR